MRQTSTFKKILWDLRISKWTLSSPLKITGSNDLGFWAYYTPCIGDAPYRGMSNYLFGSSSLHIFFFGGGGGDV